MRKYLFFLTAFLAAAGAAAVLLWTLRERPVKVTVPERIKAPVLPRVAIVLDDLGYSKKDLEKLKEIGVPLTVAVLPDTPYAAEAAAFAVTNGMDVILHCPMEPLNYKGGLEKSTITAVMDDETVKKTFNDSLAKVNFSKGISNHMGSKLTADKRAMRVIFAELKNKGLFYLDSRTSGSTVCPEIAKETGVSFIDRDIFLDNTPEEGAISAQMDKAAKIARIFGDAVAIGHYKTVTIEALKNIVPRLRSEGIEFVRLSELVVTESKK